jgi:hypothetical protein
MIETVLMQISAMTPHASEFGNMPAETLPLSTLSCGLGALVLSKFTGSLGLLTVPVNYSALFIGAVFSNWLLHGLDLPIDKLTAQPLLITLVGMTIAAFSMMYWLQRDGIH